MPRLADATSVLLPTARNVSAKFAVCWIGWISHETSETSDCLEMQISFDSGIAAFGRVLSHQRIVELKGLLWLIFDGMLLFLGG